MKPSVRELQRNGSAYPGWRVCPICRGGRGEVIPVLDEETGEIIEYQVVDCILCNGEKVIPRT
jgi:hypothetical protein